MTEKPEEILVPLEEVRGIPFVVEVPGLRRLVFAPHSDHRERRVEWVPESVANELMRRHNTRFQKLAIARDLEAVEPEPESVATPKPRARKRARSAR